MYGWSRDELQSMRVADLVAEGHPVVGINVEPSHELPGRPIETVNLRANGDPFAVEITTRLQTLGTDQLLLVVVRDISERKKVEEAQRQVQWMKEEFIVSMSHGLRTPLHTLKGFLELLSSGKVKDPEVHQDFLARADGDARRLITMVNNLIEAAQLESGELTLALEDIDFSELIRETLASMEALARERGVRVEHSLPSGPLFAQASRDRLRQVLVNLVENAINVSTQGQAVRVAAESVRGEAIWVRVIDQGPGIPASREASLFERQPPASGSEADSPMATGLGLYISKRIIEAHGGNLRVESSLGKGSTFFWSIPVKAELVDDRGHKARS
jgi:signal transduction histidine kinase